MWDFLNPGVLLQRVISDHLLGLIVGWVPPRLWVRRGGFLNQNATLTSDPRTVQAVKQYEKCKRNDTDRSLPKSK